MLSIYQNLYITRKTSKLLEKGVFKKTRGLILPVTGVILCYQSIKSCISQEKPILAPIEIGVFKKTQGFILSVTGVILCYQYINTCISQEKPVLAPRSGSV